MGHEPSRPAVILPFAAGGQVAAEAPGPAVIAGRTWTWPELDRAAETMSAALAGVTAGRPARIGLLAATGESAIALLHGAGRIGVTVLPLNGRLAPAELAGLLDAAQVEILLADDEHLALARSLRRRAILLEDLLAGRMAAQTSGMPVAPTLSGPDEPAVAVATSGTTGRSKLALLTHAQLAASASAWMAALPPATGWLASLSMAHVGGLGIIWRAALAGVPVVVPSETGPDGLLVCLERAPVSHFSLVATQLSRLLDAVADGPPPPGVRAVLLGGGPIPAVLVTRALDAGWPVVPTYGLTETCSGVTALPTAAARATPESAGTPLPGVKLRIASPGLDAIGEIEVSGPSVFSGYLDRDDETAAAFTPDGWLRTGDLGRIEDGRLFVADRRLDLIVSGGENVYPAQIELVLASHPAVRDAGVIGRPSAEWGSVPLAYVALIPGRDVSDAELRAFCAQRLAGYEVPVAFLRTPEIPRGTSGKLDRAALRRLADRDASPPGDGVRG